MRHRDEGVRSAARRGQSGPILHREILMSLSRAIVGLLLGLLPFVTHANQEAQQACERVHLACATACPAGTAGMGPCMQRCGIDRSNCRAAAQGGGDRQPPAASDALRAATPGPARNAMARQRELSETGSCLAAARTCAEACGPAPVQAGSAEGFRHMECMGACKVEQARCGIRAEQIERGERQADGRCKPGQIETGTPGTGVCRDLR